MIKTMVTGAGGFIGRHVMRKLAPIAGEHHAIDLNPRPEGLPSSVTWHQADIMNPDAMAELISEIRPQRLLHLAWITTHGEYWNSAENFRWVEASLRLFRVFVEAGGT